MVFRLHLLQNNPEFRAKNQANTIAYRESLINILESLENSLPKTLVHEEVPSQRGTNLEAVSVQPSSCPVTLNRISQLIKAAKQPHDATLLKTSKKEEKPGFFARFVNPIKAAFKGETYRVDGNFFADQYLDFQYHPRLWSSDRSGHTPVALSEELEKTEFTRRSTTYEELRKELESLLEISEEKSFTKKQIKAAIKELDTLQKKAVTIFRKNFRDATIDELDKYLNNIISEQASGSVHYDSINRDAYALKNRLAAIKNTNYKNLSTRSDSLNRNKELNQLRNDLLAFDKKYTALGQRAVDKPLAFKISFDEIIRRLKKLPKQLPSIEENSLQDTRASLISRLQTLKQQGYRSINLHDTSEHNSELTQLRGDLLDFQTKYNTNRQANASYLHFEKNAKYKPTETVPHYDNKLIEEPNLNLKTENVGSISPKQSQNPKSQPVRKDSDPVNGESLKPEFAKTLEASNEPSDFSALVKQMSILGKAYIDPYYERGAANPKKWWEKLRHWIKVNAMLVGGSSTILFIVSLFVPFLWPATPFFAAGSFLALAGILDPIIEMFSNFMHGRSPSKAQGIELSVIATLITTFFAGPTAFAWLGLKFSELAVYIKEISLSSIKNIVATSAKGAQKLGHLFPLAGKFIGNVVAKFFPSVNAPAGVGEVVKTRTAAAVPQTSAEFKEFPIGDARTVLSLLDDSQPSLKAQKNLIGISSNTRSIQQVLNVDFATKKPTPEKGISKAFFVYGKNSDFHGGVNNTQTAEMNYAVPTKGLTDINSRKKIVYSRHEKISNWNLGFNFFQKKFASDSPEKQIQKALDTYKALNLSLDTSIQTRQDSLENLRQLLVAWMDNHAGAKTYLNNKDSRSQLKTNLKTFEKQGLSKQQAKVVLLSQWVNKEIETLQTMQNDSAQNIYLVKASI